MAQKFAWLVVDLENGTVDGTNDADLIDNLVEDANYVCINQQSECYFWGNRNQIMITALDDEELEVDDEDDEDDDDDDTSNNPSEGVAP